MRKKLAIHGHSTRGKEVIELLEMMGGSNMYQHDGEANAYSYYISGNVILHDRLSIAEDDDFEIFTLQGFLEKFPFKVGDFVRIPEYESEVRICKMKWTSFSDIDYLVYRNDNEEWYTAYELLQYNDNPRKTTKDMEEKKINQMSLANCDLDEVEIVLGDKFELKIEDGKYYAVRKKLTYPKTYLECREMLGESAYYGFSVYATLQNLIICRNAYWKIAGKEMKLGKSWKPDFTNDDEERYGIYTAANKVVKDFCGVGDVNTILTFPTVEMRDEFYNNFRDLIEQCKELL
jgi:hypothetical protein